MDIYLNLAWFILIYFDLPTGNDFSFRTSVDQATRFPWSAARGPVPTPDPSPGGTKSGSIIENMVG